MNLKPDSFKLSTKSISIPSNISIPFLATEMSIPDFLKFKSELIGLLIISRLYAKSEQPPERTDTLKIAFPLFSFLIILFIFSIAVFVNFNEKFFIFLGFSD